MNGRGVFRRFGFVFKFGALFFKFMPLFACEFFWSCTCIFDGPLARFIRYCIAKAKCEQLGANVYFGKFVRLKCFGRLRVGDNVSVHDYCYIDATGSVVISDNVSIAHSCSIVSFEHAWDDVTVPIKYNKVKYSSVRIESDCWIGCGTRILSGVTVGTRSVVAAGAVVVADVKANHLYGGVPARIIKELSI